MKHASAFLSLVEQTLPSVREIGCEEVAGQLAQGRPFAFIDVREESEWSAGHAQGAAHIGKGVIERDIERAVPDKNAPVVLYCGGGYRSVLAADALQKMGYANVYSMAGGWREWCERGYPMA